MNEEQPQIQNPKSEIPSLVRLWLVVMAVVGGAVVMAVELLGARLLNVRFGESLTVWAAMISVTLLSLAVGYSVGGRLADRLPRPGLLYALALTASVLTAACPHAQFILDACNASMGLRAGALAGSAILFFLPLGLMGVTSPFVIGVLSRTRVGVGTTAGVVYALSTLGSVAGTLFTGLWLVPNVGTAAGFRIAAVTLAAAGAIGLVLSAPRRGAVALLLPLGLAFLPSPTLAVGAEYTAPDGSPVKVLAIQDSAYGRLVVLQKADYRLLVANGIVQTGVPRSIAEMPKAQALANSRYFQELLPYTVDDPEGRRVLIIGLAGGMTATLLKQYEMEVDSVDLDPAVIDLARRYFWFDGPAVAEDGRRFLERCLRQYDFCVIDTYSGDVFPFHLSSAEAFRAAKAVLTEDGILALNFIGAPTGPAFHAIYRTLGAVFPHVLALRGEEGDDVQTITLFAGRREIEFNHGWMRHLRGFAGVDPVSDALSRLRIVPPAGAGLVLTDNYNPLSFLRASEALRWRTRTAAFIGPEAARL
jgi:spermidine synthase